MDVIKLPEDFPKIRTTLSLLLFLYKLDFNQENLIVQKIIEKNKIE